MGEVEGGGSKRNKYLEGIGTRRKCRFGKDGVLVIIFLKGEKVTILLLRFFVDLYFDYLLCLV